MKTPLLASRALREPSTLVTSYHINEASYCFMLIPAGPQVHQYLPSMALAIVVIRVMMFELEFSYSRRALYDFPNRDYRMCIFVLQNASLTCLLGAHVYTGNCSMAIPLQSMTWRCKMEIWHSVSIGMATLVIISWLFHYNPRRAIDMIALRSNKLGV